MEALRLHAGEGRLTFEELDGRTEAAARARTLGDLEVLLADVPRVRLPSDERALRVRAAAEFRRHLHGYIAVNVVLLIIWASTGAGYPWFLWSLLGWGVALVVYAAPLLATRGPRADRRMLGT